MTDTAERRLHSAIFRIAHATGIYFIFFIVNFYCGSNLRSKIFLRNAPDFWSIPLYCKVGFVYSLMLFFSLISVFTLNDYTYKKRFLEADSANMIFLKKCKFVVTDRAFIIELATVCFWVLVLPLRVFWFDLVYGFYDSYAMLAIILPIVSLLIFIAHMASVNWWQRISQKKGYTYSPKESLISLLKQFALTVVAYVFSAFALSIVFPMLATAWNFAKYLGLILIVIIAALIAVFLSIRKMRLVLSRRKLIKGLTKLSGENKCTVRSTNKIYSNKSNSRITIEKEGVIYSCKLVCAPKYRTPLYFHDDGNMRYTKGYTFLGIDIFYHEITTKYFFAGEGNKILIIVPATVRAISSDGHSERKIWAGDKIMEYTVHDTQSFLGAIDRNCL